MLGGAFSSISWEDERENLHHGDYCHGFYNFIGSSGGVTESVNRQSLIEHLRGADLRGPLKRAFANWRAIADKQAALLARAPREGLYAVDAKLAFAARESAGLWADATLAGRVTEAAGAVLARVALEDAQRIRLATDELNKIADRIGAFVALCQSGARVPEGEIVSTVDGFLADVQALHAGWSALPRRLCRAEGT